MPPVHSHTAQHSQLTQALADGLCGSLAPTLLALRDFRSDPAEVWRAILPGSAEGVWLSFKLRGYWIDGSDNLLTRLDKWPELNWQPASETELEPVRLSRKMLPLFRLYWMAGMSSGRDHLLPWLNPHTTWRLVSWPVFFKVPHYPTFPRLAKAAGQRAMSLTEFEVLANNNSLAAINFVNATSMTGWLADAALPAPQPSPTMHPLPTPAQQLARLLRRLFERTHP